MTPSPSKPLKSQILYLGWYQIIGGGLGIIFIAWWLLGEGIVWNTTTILLASLFLLFDIYSILCGLFCIDVKKNALKHSLCNQAMQAIHFYIAGYGFSYAAGIYLTLGVNTSSSESLVFGLGLSKGDIQFNFGDGYFAFSINLIALGIIYWILQLIKKINRERELQLI